MAYVVETITHPDIDEVYAFEEISISVLERTKGEVVGSGRIIDIEMPMIQSYTAKELVSLGEWFVKQGKRIKKEYTNTGHKIRT